MDEGDTLPSERGLCHKGVSSNRAIAIKVSSLSIASANRASIRICIAGILEKVASTRIKRYDC
jgi:hypothetical protein